MLQRLACELCWEGCVHCNAILCKRLGPWEVRKQVRFIVNAGEPAASTCSIRRGEWLAGDSWDHRRSCVTDLFGSLSLPALPPPPPVDTCVLCLCWSISRYVSLRRSLSISLLSGQDQPGPPAGDPGNSSPEIEVALPVALPRPRSSWAPVSPLLPGPGPGPASGTLHLLWPSHPLLPRSYHHPPSRPHS